MCSCWHCVCVLCLRQSTRIFRSAMQKATTALCRSIHVYDESMYVCILTLRFCFCRLDRERKEWELFFHLNFSFIHWCDAVLLPTVFIYSYPSERTLHHTILRDWLYSSRAHTHTLSLARMTYEITVSASSHTQRILNWHIPHHIIVDCLGGMESSHTEEEWWEWARRTVEINSYFCRV